MIVIIFFPEVQIDFCGLGDSQKRRLKNVTARIEAAEASCFKVACEAETTPNDLAGVTLSDFLSQTQTNHTLQNGPLLRDGSVGPTGHSAVPSLVQPRRRVCTRIHSARAQLS